MAQNTKRAERRAHRNAVRQARRNARLALGRGGVLPRTVWGIVGWMLMFALGAGAATAVTAAVFDARITEVSHDLTDRLERRAPQLGAAVSVAQDEPTIATVADARVTVGARGSAPEIEVTGTAVASDGSRTFWAVPVSSVRSAMIAPPSTIRVVGSFGVADAVLWSWDEGAGLALIEADIGGLTVRPWATELPEPGSELTIVVPPGTTGVPVLVPAVAFGGDAGQFSIETAQTDAVAPGAPVVDGTGALAGIVVANDEGLVALSPDRACGRLLRC